MKFIKITFLLVLVALIAFSCKKQSSNRLITEPAFAAYYFINNQSNQSLKVVYTTDEPDKTDSTQTITIPEKTTQKVYKNGSIGVTPTPSHTFSKIIFYNGSGSSVPSLVISPVKNDQWDVVSRKAIQKPHYHLLTKYELVITNKDISN